MKTLYLTDSSSNIVIDTETNETFRLNKVDRYEIRDIYYAEEPMHIVYGNGDDKEEADAKKGDIIVLFYSNTKTPNRLVVLKSKDWAKNITTRRKLDQEEKEKWASANLQSIAECEAISCGN